MSQYIHNFRNSILPGSDISTDDKWDALVERLKPTLAFEVRKENCMTFEDTGRVALE